MSQITIELGNADPILASGSNPEGDEPLGAPTVTYLHIPVDPENFPEGHHAYAQKIDSTFSGRDIYDHVADRLMNGDGSVTRLPGYEAVLAVVSPFGTWRAHAQPNTKPTWVRAWAPGEYAEQAAEVERLISEYYGCPRGAPVDVEVTHFTSHNLLTYAPGEAPVEGAVPPLDLEANITQNGRDIQSRTAFGGAVGVTGQGSAATATTLTTASTLTLNQATGYRVYVADTTNHVIVWGNGQSSTAGADAVITVDRWYNAATPGGAAATTPAAGFEWMLSDGGGPSSWFIGLSTSTATINSPSTNTTLPSEITSSGGGLVRQISPWAHTASTAVTTLTPVFTANSSDSLPAVIASMGTFNSMVVGAVPNMFFNTAVSPTATLAESGDQLTLTQTITGT